MVVFRFLYELDLLVRISNLNLNKTCFLIEIEFKWLKSSSIPYYYIWTIFAQLITNNNLLFVLLLLSGQEIIYITINKIKNLHEMPI